MALAPGTPPPPRSGRPLRAARAGALPWGAADLLPLVAAATIPLVFLHVRYQPRISVGRVTAYASDIAILLTVLAAIISGLLFGWGRLTRHWRLWSLIAALVAIFAAACFWRPFQELGTHLVTVAKYGEYALLAPAIVLLLRRQVDVRRFLAVFVLWAAAASGWGLLQFLGVVNEIGGKRPHQRETSFIGHEFLGSFTGAALVLGLAALALGERRPWVFFTVLAGGVGVVLDGSISVYLGLALAVVAIAVVAWRAGRLPRRPLAALVVVVLAIGAGVGGLRGPDISNYLSVVGLSSSSSLSSTGLQTGSQRELLSYIGLRIWEAHPWLGVGFDHSGDRYQPFLAAARRRFPGDPPLAFPSPAHPWGIQDFWLQVLADTGVVGFALTVAVFAGALVAALRAFAHNRLLALAATGWILLTVGTWTALGIVAGVSLDALTFLAIGLALVASEVEAGPDPAGGGASV